MSVYRHLTLAEREYIMVQRARGRIITAIVAASASSMTRNGLPWLSACFCKSTGRRSRSSTVCAMKAARTLSATPPSTVAFKRAASTTPTG